MAIVGNCPGLGDDFITQLNEVGKAPDRSTTFGEAVAQADSQLPKLVSALVGTSPSGVADFQRQHPAAVPILIGAAEAVAMGGAELEVQLVDDGPLVSVEQEQDVIAVKVHILDQ